MNRRAFLTLGTVAGLAGPGLTRLASAQSRSDREHRIDLDVPILSEEPAAVPIRVAVEHPMEPDHYIQSIEVSIDRDPVPAKGKFLFSPANGRPWAAYQMRSGTVSWTAAAARHPIAAPATGRGTRNSAFRA
jgi:predicted secreted protein